MNIKNVILEKLERNKEFSQSFLWRTVQVFGKQGASFALFLTATFFLSKEDMGIYNYVFSALSLLVIFADFGISTATSKFVAEYNTVNKEKLSRVLFNSTLIVGIVAMIVTILVLIFGNRWFGDFNEYMVIILPLVFLSPFTSLLDGIFRGLKRFKELAFVSLVTGAISIGAIFLLIFKYQLVGALWAQNILFGVYFLVLIFRYRANVHFKLDGKIMKDIVRYSLVFGAATLGYYLFSRVNILILGSYNFLEEIATYELLNKIYLIFLMPFTIIGQVLSPSVTELFVLKKYDQVRSIFKKILVYFFGICLLFVPTTIIVIKLGIGLFLPEYDTSMLVALLLPVSITYSQMAFSAPISTGMVVATGHASIMTILNIITGAINVVLNIFVIQYFGYIGVIWTTLGVQSIALVLLCVIYWRKIVSLKK
jgi:O-antigen/teichoic acid export membrane protein